MERAEAVICDHGNCLASGPTFFFWDTNTTKWSVCSHRVYKHSCHECIFVPLSIPVQIVFNIFSCIFLVK